MSLFLHIPVSSFQSEYVPQQSVFSGRTDRLTFYAWRWSRILKTSLGTTTFVSAMRGARIPCARYEVFWWRAQRLCYVMAAMFFGISGLLAGPVFAIFIAANPTVGTAGLLIGTPLLGLAFVFTHFSLTKVVRIQPHGDGVSVVMFWPPNRQAVYDTYREALNLWMQAGCPLPAHDNQDSYAEQIAPGWDVADGKRGDASPDSTAQ